MNFEFSNKVIELQNKLTNFMNENVYKNEEVFEDQLNRNGRWTIPPILEELKNDLENLNLDELTPIEALLKLNELKRKINN